MFCGQCGTQNADDARFCSNCGEVLNAAPAPEPVVPPKKSKKGLLFIIGGAVLALALVLILIFGGGAKSKAKKALNAVENGNASKIMKLLPKEVKEAMGDKDDQQEVQEELQEILDEIQEWMEEDNGSIDFKILDVQKLDEDEVEELQELYEYYMDADIKIKAAKEIEVKMTIKEDGDKETETFSMYMIKVGSKWYLDYYSIAELISELY